MAKGSEIQQASDVTIDVNNILIVEDETIFAKAVARRLQRADFECRVVDTLAGAKEAMQQCVFNLVLLDMRLPDGSGLDFLEYLRARNEATPPVVVMTAYGEVDDAVNAMKLAAVDYLKKPIDLDELSIAVNKALESERISSRLALSLAREAHVTEVQSIVGESAPVQALRKHIERIAGLGQDVDMMPPTVLITGETGTGKDLAARSLHAASVRHEQPFVHVDCASLPRDLIEAELFGHEKGAFTNAHTERTGLIEMAEEGVVFLDEIGELPPELQTKLLGVLERRVVRRVGSSRERPIRAWFIAATNRDVDEMLSTGSLRSDLYFRLNVLTLELPPLRERGTDVLLLAAHIGEQVARRYAMSQFRLDASAERALQDYRWPGNVRELRHVIERAVLLSGDHALGVEALMLPRAESGDPAPQADLSGLSLDEAERSLIVNALNRCQDNVSAAARELGITRMAMRYRMKKYNLE